MLLSAAPVMAQDVPEAPAGAPITGPVSILPNLATPSDADSGPTEPSVDVGDIAAPGVDRIGLVDTAMGGFSPQLWRGTDLETLREIMPRLPRRVNSPAERHLLKNLLLSPGAPPAAPRGEDSVGGTDAVAALNASQWLLETRVATLAGLGEWADVQALMELVPPAQMTEGLKRLKTEANLVTNHVNPACTEAQAALATSPDPYWQKIQVFCQYSIDQASAASLGLSILREQHVDDAVFFWAIDVLGGNPAPAPAGFTKLEPLHYAMLRKANATLPANLADVQSKITDPSTLGWLAALQPAEEVAVKGDKTPEAVKRERRRALEEARILLTERAVAVGTIGVDALRALYAKVDAKNPAPPPLSQITAGDVRGRALLYQSALAQTVPTARAEVIALALDLVRVDKGEKGPDLTVMGPAYANMLEEMEPSGDLVWFAGTAARALLAAGPEDRVATEKAKGWVDLSRNMARTSSDAGLVADSIWPVEKLLAPSGTPIPPQALRAWTAALPTNLAPDVAAQRRETLLSVLAAAGEPVTSADWQGLLNGPVKSANVSLLSPAIWNGLDLAAKSKRVGEASALALVALGEDGTHISLASLQHVIESLRAVGREDDARALAVEALLVSGL